MQSVGNGYIESFNGRLRDECLNVELFWSVEDARAKLEKWRVDYNVHRPHSSLANLPPGCVLPMDSDRESQQQIESSWLSETQADCGPEIGRRSLPRRYALDGHPCQGRNQRLLAALVSLKNSG